MENSTRGASGIRWKTTREVREGSGVEGWSGRLENNTRGASRMRSGRVENSTRGPNRIAHGRPQPSRAAQVNVSFDEACKFGETSGYVSQELNYFEAWF